MSAREVMNKLHTCGLRSGECCACVAQLKLVSDQAVAAEEGRDMCGPTPAYTREGRRIAELERELAKTHAELRNALAREQQVLRERLKLEHQLSVIRCVVSL